MFAFNFAPRGWAFCNGQLLPISQNTAVFSLLGTNYGGDGKSTFGLPNLAGSVAIHTDEYSGGGNYPIGAAAGEQSLALLTSEIPNHSHAVTAATVAFATNATSPSGTVFSNATPTNLYGPSTTPNTTMSPSMVGISGSGLAHNNMQPTLVLNFCIALQGIFPPRA